MAPAHPWRTSETRPAFTEEKIPTRKSAEHATPRLDEPHRTLSDKANNQTVHFRQLKYTNSKPYPARTPTGYGAYDVELHIEGNFIRKKNSGQPNSPCAKRNDGGDTVHHLRESLQALVHSVVQHDGLRRVHGRTANLALRRRHESAAKAAPPMELIASWPVSRVLYGSGRNRNVAAIPLGQRSHAASRNPPG
jgi:hypothetical protein